MKEDEHILEKALEAIKNEQIPPGPPQELVDATVTKLAETRGQSDTVPFGGVGASGIGNYHGFDGFKTFSHARAVLRQPKISVERLIGLIPPYGKKIHNAINMDLKG